MSSPGRSERVGRRRNLGRAAGSLTAVQLLGYLVPLVLLPYLSRVLGVVGFSAFIFSQAAAAWAGMIVEYGHGFSATRRAAGVGREPAAREWIAQGTFGSKAALTIVAAMAAGAMQLAASPGVAPPELLWALWAGSVAWGWTPRWYFQAEHRLVEPAIARLIARSVSALLVVVLVRAPSDLATLGLLLAMGETGASAAVTAQLYREIRWRPPSLSATVASLRDGAGAFVFTAATSLYTALNVVILGVMAPASEVAMFGASEKVVRAFISLMTPASTVIYARMASLGRSPRTALRFVSGIGALLLAVTSAAAVATALAAVPILRVAFGGAFVDGAPTLRILAVILPLVGLGNVLGIQWFMARRVEGPFLAAVFMGGACNIAAAVFLTPRWGAEGMAAATLLAETTVVLMLVGALWRRGELGLLVGAAVRGVRLGATARSGRQQGLEGEDCHRAG